MKYVLLVIGFIFSGVSNSESVNSDFIFFTDIAKGEYNRIVLPQPYKNIVISKGARIDKPIKLNGGRLVLIRPLETALKVFNATFVLADGETFQLVFNPVKQERPIVWRYRDAADVQEHVGPTLNDKHLWLSRLFPEAHDVYYGRAEKGISAPRGFTQITLPNTISAAVRNSSGSVTKLKLVPRMAWRGMGHVLNAYQLNSADKLKIEPSDFWYKGVVAVSAEFDFVTKNKSPYVFILSKDI